MCLKCIVVEGRVQVDMLFDSRSEGLGFDS